LSGIETGAPGRARGDSGATDALKDVEVLAVGFWPPALAGRELSRAFVPTSL
jgi:hypothetical protein